MRARMIQEAFRRRARTLKDGENLLGDNRPRLRELR